MKLSQIPQDDEKKTLKEKTTSSQYLAENIYDIVFGEKLEELYRDEEKLETFFTRIIRFCNKIDVYEREGYIDSDDKLVVFKDEFESMLYEMPFEGWQEFIDIFEDNRGQLTVIRNLMKKIEFIKRTVGVNKNKWMELKASLQNIINEKEPIEVKKMRHLYSDLMRNFTRGGLSSLKQGNYAEYYAEYKQALEMKIKSKYLNKNGELNDEAFKKALRVKLYKLEEHAIRVCGDVDSVILNNVRDFFKNPKVLELYRKLANLSEFNLDVSIIDGMFDYLYDNYESQSDISKIAILDILLPT